MSGLIIKDLLYVKNLRKNFIVIFIGSLLVSIGLQNYIYVICIVPAMLVSMGVSTFQADEFFNTEIYALTYPVSRKEIVTSKYLFTLLLFFMGTIIGIILFIIFSLFISNLSFNIILYLLMLEIVCLIINFIFYPIIYKYGCEKSSFILTTIIIFAMAVISILSSVLNYANITINFDLDFEQILNFVNNYGLIILSIAIIFISVISYYISYKVYEKLDF